MIGVEGVGTTAGLMGRKSGLRFFGFRPGFGRGGSTYFFEGNTRVKSLDIRSVGESSLAGANGVSPMIDRLD